jgi:hypothetical protein
MKKQNEKNIANKAFLLRKNHKEMEREIEDQPIRLDEKVISDKLLHVDHSSDTEPDDLLKKARPPRKIPGSHSLSSLRSFRFK